MIALRGEQPYPLPDVKTFGIHIFARNQLRMPTTWADSRAKIRVMRRSEHIEIVLLRGGRTFILGHPLKMIRERPPHSH
jgi:hypothetical protein